MAKYLHHTMDWGIVYLMTKSDPSLPATATMDLALSDDLTVFLFRALLTNLWVSLMLRVPTISATVLSLLVMHFLLCGGAISYSVDHCHQLH